MTISAASLATSVPEMPIATPTFGPDQGGRVVHAVAGHGDDLASPLVGLDDAQLLRRMDAGEDGDVLDSRFELGVGHALELGSIDRFVAIVGDAQRLRDRDSRSPCGRP